MSACPKCGDSQGFRFISTERNVYIGDWEGGRECVDGECVLGESMPECLACGHKFRWSTVNAIVGDEVTP